MDKLGRLIINSVAFAQEGRSLAGQAAPAELPRLAQALADQGGSIEWRLSGTRDQHGKRYLTLVLQGELHLICQRCLGVLTHALDVESRLLLVPPGAPWPDETLDDDSADAIEALSEQPVLALLEDEVLLALPLAPRHLSCEPPGDGSAGDESEAPLRNLAKLRQRLH
jgi:uncharacterized protein